MKPLPLLLLVPLVPVRFWLWAGTIWCLWLLLSIAAHFLIFRPLFRRNERL